MLPKCIYYKFPPVIYLVYYRKISKVFSRLVLSDTVLIFSLDTKYALKYFLFYCFDISLCIKTLKRHAACFACSSVQIIQLTPFAIFELRKTRYKFNYVSKKRQNMLKNRHSHSAYLTALFIFLHRQQSSYFTRIVRQILDRI